MRRRYIFDRKTQTMVPVDEYNGGLNERPRNPQIITDEMDNRLHHPATGEYTSSKSQFRKMTKAAGCTEVGNDHQESVDKPLSKEKRIDDIKKAMYETGYGRK